MASRIYPEEKTNKSHRYGTDWSRFCISWDFEDFIKTGASPINPIICKGNVFEGIEAMY